MSSVATVQGNDRDAGVVEEICGYLTDQPPLSFFLFAGAGSGKTRTLVETLRRVTGVVQHEAGGRLAHRMRLYGRSIRVVTYTKNAVSVINSRLGSNDLVAVSTIHSFCWELIGGFDDDIREALIVLKKDQLAKKIEEAKEKKRGINDKDKQEFAEIEQEIADLQTVPKFIYHPDKNTYGLGAIQHHQVLGATAWLLAHRPTLRTILQDRHPIILIDESQDTMKGVLDVLMQLAEPRGSGLTLGLLGDHRQRIYTDGHANLPGLVPEGWAKPQLQMNHRSERRVVELINKIWKSELEGRVQPPNGVVQHHRAEKTGGTVRLFIGNAALSTEDKRQGEAWCASQMKAATQNDTWASRGGYKVLALEHKLVAARGDFLDVYTAMTLIDPEAAAPSGSGENTGPSAARLLLTDLAQLAACFDTAGVINEYAATDVLRRAGCLDDLPMELETRIARTQEILAAITAFGLTCVNPESTVADVVRAVLDVGLFEIDGRLRKALNDDSQPAAAPGRGADESKDARIYRGWRALVGAPWAELDRYRNYLGGNSELATHQVVKGSEFQHVMVVMDDSQAGGNQISYDKLFGGKELSKTDITNAKANKETTIDRSLRLLYVTCSRARDSLALVLWSSKPADALVFIKGKSEWFEEGEVALIP